MAVVVGIVFALLTDELPQTIDADAGEGAVEYQSPTRGD
jgi:hypothetical protein